MESLRTLNAALRLSEEHNLQHNQAWCHNSLGVALRVMGSLDEALDTTGGPSSCWNPWQRCSWRSTACTLTSRRAGPWPPRRGPRPARPDRRTGAGAWPPARRAARPGGPGAGTGGLEDEPAVHHPRPALVAVRVEPLPDQLSSLRTWLRGV